MDIEKIKKGLEILSTDLGKTTEKFIIENADSFSDHELIIMLSQGGIIFCINNFFALVRMIDFDKNHQTDKKLIIEFKKNFIKILESKINFYEQEKIANKTAN